MKKILLFILTLIVLGAVFFAYKAYNKPHTNIATTEATESLSATQLFNHFITDETAALAQYADQVIQVKGILLNKELSNSNEPQIVLEANGDDGFIRCGFKPTELAKVEKLKTNSTVTIKGMCKGLNASDELDLLADKDVIISNCIIIE